MARHVLIHWGRESDRMLHHAAPLLTLAVLAATVALGGFTIVLEAVATGVFVVSLALLIGLLASNLVHRV
jgi:hypothetical protein